MSLLVTFCLLPLVSVGVPRLVHGRPLFVSHTSSIVLEDDAVSGRMDTPLHGGSLPGDLKTSTSDLVMSENVADFNLKTYKGTGKLKPGRIMIAAGAAVGDTLNATTDDDASMRTPEYMLDLYDKFVKSGYTVPTSNIVRSFRNSMQQGLDTFVFSDSSHWTREPKNLLVHTGLLHVQTFGQITFFRNVAGSINKQRYDSTVFQLRFNISTIPSSEHVQSAELRLYNRMECGPNTSGCAVLCRKVKVYEYSARGYRLLSSRNICGIRSEWHLFDVTSVIRRTFRKSTPIVDLQIRAQNIFRKFSSPKRDINWFPDNTSEPLLIVHSNDNSILEHKHDMHELVMHEVTSHTTGNAIYSTYAGGKPSDMYTYNASDQRSGRYKRSRGQHKSSQCRRRPMFVNFQDINWHTWIIAPRRYQAYQCAGRCYFPLNDHLTPSKHAIVQTMLHARYPRSATRACCVPTRLDPISILYVDEQGVITYKYKYDGMVVGECGCR